MCKSVNNISLSVLLKFKWNIVSLGSYVIGKSVWLSKSWDTRITLRTNLNRVLEKKCNLIIFNAIKLYVNSQSVVFASIYVVK